MRFSQRPSQTLGKKSARLATFIYLFLFNFIVETRISFAQTTTQIQFSETSGPANIPALEALSDYLESDDFLREVMDAEQDLGPSTQTLLNDQNKIDCYSLLLKMRLPAERVPLVFEKEESLKSPNPSL